MNELEAAIGLGSLDKYEQILKKRRENLKYLMKEFRRFSPRLVSIEADPYEKIGPHAFPVTIQEQANFTREELVNFLERHGIETRTLFLSMPTQCPGFRFLGYKLGEFPNAEYIGNNGFHIGIYQDLKKEHLDYFLTTIENFLTKKLKSKI